MICIILKWKYTFWSISLHAHFMCWEKHSVFYWPRMVEPMWATLFVITDLSSYRKKKCGKIEQIWIILKYCSELPQKAIHRDIEALDLKWTELFASRPPTTFVLTLSHASPLTSELDGWMIRWYFCTSTCMCPVFLHHCGTGRRYSSIIMLIWLTGCTFSAIQLYMYSSLLLHLL